MLEQCAEWDAKYRSFDGYLCACAHDQRAINDLPQLFNGELRRSSGLLLPNRVPSSEIYATNSTGLPTHLISLPNIDLPITSTTRSRVTTLLLLLPPPPHQPPPIIYYRF